jgi:predicted phage terminase large subunit-like protein
VEPDTEYIPNWHIEAIADHLDAVVTGEIKDLIINVPPGFMKSLMTSVFWPAWTWIHKPGMRFFFASYDQTLSTRDSVRTRQVISSLWYQERWGDRFELTGDQNEKTRFDNDRRGWRLATSIGGRGTGEHPDIIVCDDPHNTKKVVTDAERQSAIQWWDGTISSRGKIRKVRRVVIMQRLHVQDLTGHILEKDGSWVHLCLPMRYEKKHPFPTKSSIGWKDPRRKESELLWEDAFPKETVQEMERDMTSVRAAGQLQQRPAPAGGSLLRREWFDIVKAPPVQAARIRYWDKAATEGGGADSAGVLVSLAGSYFFIEDVVDGKWSPGRRNTMMKNTAVLDHQRYGGAVMIAIEQEPGSGGKESALLSVQQLRGYPVYIDNVRDPKEVRAETMAAQAEHGFVKLVEGPWNRKFLDEAEHFPAGKLKDLIDAAAGAIVLLAQGDWDILGDDVLASGEDPEAEREPLSDEEIAELPADIRSILEDLRDHADDTGFRDRDRDPWELY